MSWQNTTFSTVANEEGSRNHRYKLVENKRHKSNKK